MPVHDDLGKRMKEYYEAIPKTKLMRRCPVAIRIDGKAFQTFTRGFEKPFDKILMRSMQETMLYLCKNIQGCKFGYAQSDEITLILTDYDTFETQAWFDYEVQKMCSIAASMATMALNKCFVRNIQSIVCKTNDMEEYVDDGNGQLIPTEKHYANILNDAAEKGAMFDARCFNIPKEEVTNYFIWRQQDATRNSIQMVARSKFSDKKLFKLNSNQIQELLFQEAEINWNDFPIEQKRGSCFTYRYEDVVIEDNCGNQEILEEKMRRWFLDREIPVFTQDRDYIERTMRFEKEL